MRSLPRRSARCRIGTDQPNYTDGSHPNRQAPWESSRLFRRRQIIGARPTRGSRCIGAAGRTADLAARISGLAALAVGGVSAQAKLGALVAVAGSRAALVAAPVAVATLAITDFV